jgi:error-prone DNA polymerase
MLPDYAELHCLSNFTFLRGASHAEELVARAVELGYSALAITDECSFAGSVRAHLAHRELGELGKSLKLIHGTELRLVCGLTLVLLAKNRDGYGNLSALVTLGRRNAAKGLYRLTRGDLAGWNGDGVPDCLALWVPPKVGDGGTALEQARWVAEHFAGRAWIAFERHLAPDDAQRLAGLRELSAQTGLPMLAAGYVHMHVRSRRPLQDALTALRLNTTVQTAGQALFPNGERHLRSRLALARLHSTELLAETLTVAAQCKFSLDELRYEYPDEVVPAGETPMSWLVKCTEKGLHKRYGLDLPEKIRYQVDHEYALIAELDYAPYFLTVYEIVAWAREQKILCQGRGSAANSAVCYALEITAVDPAISNPLFERFVSRERKEPPDIDVDFEHERREEVIQHIYAKYGRERAALAAAVICYRKRGALRDAGRALGFAAPAINALAGNLAWWDSKEEWPERFAEVGIDPNDPLVKRWMMIATELRGMPRHLSQHVGGFVIARGRLDRLVPIENASMPNRTVIQWDKDDIDALGLMKVDVLALGMLSALRRMLASVSRTTGQTFGLENVPREDPATYAMIRRADTIGVFQIESRAQMSMLPRLQPREFYDLVIQVAIVRPGPIQGGMVHPYLRQRHSGESVKWESEKVRKVLERTCGVPIFQEQAMQLAIVAADFTPGEADQLRRSMAAWKRKGGIGPFRERLLGGMAKNGYSVEFSEALYRQMEGFGEYGFPESHATGFAILVYFSAWLKCHHPAIFLTALLNAQPMGFYSAAQLVQDARRHGVEVLPADVTLSDWESVDSGNTVRLGLHQIKGLRHEMARRLVAAREQANFADLTDLSLRAELNRGDLDLLADAGALVSLSGHRRQAAWSAAAIPLQHDLLAGLSRETTEVQLTAAREGEEVVADYRRLGLTLGRHPLALLRERFVAKRYTATAQLVARGDRALVRVAGLVTCRQRPGTAGGVTFLTLEDETGNANVVIFKDVAERQRRFLLGSRLLGVAGQLQVQGEGEHVVVHLIAKRLFDHSELLGELMTQSRDFH